MHQSIPAVVYTKQLDGSCSVSIDFLEVFFLTCHLIVFIILLGEGRNCENYMYICKNVKKKNLKM